MFDKVAAIVVVEKHGGGDWSPPVVLHGAAPADLDVAALQSACGDKPALRKQGQGLAIMLPEPPSGWVIWLLDHMPPVTALPELVDRLGRLTRDLRGTGGTPPDTAKPIFDLLLPRLARSEKRDRATVAQMLADACVENNLARSAVVADLRYTKVRRLYYSDSRLAPFADEFRFLIRTYLGDDPASHDLSQDDLSVAGLDGALLNDMAGSLRMMLDLPARGEGGLALILFDPVAVPSDLGRLLAALGLLAIGRKPAKPLRRRIVQGAVAAAMLGLVIWLALPAPLVVTATAVSEPQGAVAMALPVAGFVDSIDVRVGDVVASGDVIASFRAPDLEERYAALVVELATENVVAQTALSSNDYGAFLLSQQKIESATMRQNRLQERLAELDMRAEVAGRVVSAMGPDTTGRFVQMGETVAVVQPRAVFSAKLTVSRVDAPLLQRGQQGEIWFRGLSDRSWPVETETPVVLETAPDGSTENLILRARLLDDDQQQLFAGLAGFARIEVGQQMRVRVLSRYATEYIRGKAWIWFGLTF